MINFTTETQWSTVNKPMALLTRVLADFRCLDARIASMAQSSVVVSNETRVSQLLRAQLATEAVRMETCLHRFDHTTNNDVTTLGTERSIKNSEIPFAILATFEFVENSVWEGSEALSAPKILN